MKLQYLVETGVIAGYNVYPDADGNDVLNLHFMNGENVVIKASPTGHGESAGLLVDGEEITPAEIGPRVIVMGSTWLHRFGLGERVVEAVEPFIKVNDIGPGGWPEERFRHDFTHVKNP